MNKKTTKTHVIDIETIAQPEATIRAKLPPFSPENVALGNLKDPDKITAKIAEARLTYGDDIVEKGALYPEYGQVAINGMFDGDTVTQYTTLNCGDERAMLTQTMWDMVAIIAEEEFITGWNIKGFDLPFMVKRCWILGVPVPRQIFDPFNPKYPWSKKFIDLMEVYGAGVYGAKYSSLDSILAILGLPAKTGDGKDFGAMWAKDKSAALAYNAADLTREHQVAMRLMGGVLE